jgi:hypothetical protein
VEIIRRGKDLMMTVFKPTTLLDHPAPKAVERPPEAVLPSSPGQAHEMSETPADGADRRDDIVPINADYRFRRTVVGKNSRTVIWLIEQRKIRKGVSEWGFVANDRSPVGLVDWLCRRGIYPDPENCDAVSALVIEGSR